MTTLLIGLGNPDRGDDGVGVAVVRRVADLASPGVNTLVLDDPTALLDAWAGADRVVVVDAVTSGGSPGTVHSLDVTDTALPSSGWGSGGTHALGLAGMVELGRALGRLPRSLVVIGVEAGAMSRGADLSAAVAAAIEPAVRTVWSALGQGDR